MWSIAEGTRPKQECKDQGGGCPVFQAELSRALTGVLVSASASSEF